MEMSIVAVMRYFVNTLQLSCSHSIEYQWVLIRLVVVVSMMILAPLPATANEAHALVSRPWVRHTIDDSSEGADGVRLADANGDGWPDVVTGWEEGNRVRLYLNPGPERARERWPAVTVGHVNSPEDAVLVDLDGDGALDVVSCCEGKTRSVYVHWAPSDPQQILDPNAWKTEAFPALQGRAAWMFALPLDVDGRHGIDLVLGAKLAGAEVGWLRSPPDPRRLQDWTWTGWREAGWIMSLRAIDMNFNGRQDVLVSDRRGAQRGYFWLQNPGAVGQANRHWPEVRISTDDNAEFMFLGIHTEQNPPRHTICVATRDDGLRVSRQTETGWEHHRIASHPSTGTPKAAALADINGDGQLDLIYTCENAHEELRGIVWISGWDHPDPTQRQVHDISGPQGVKFDRMELRDLDGDGDLDLMTCEERANLGVIWYENPSR